MTTSGRSSQFCLPPVMHTTDGRVRRAGFEFEFAGPDIKTSARIVSDVFGGEHLVRSTFEHIVRTELGDFSVEIDASLLKDKKYEKPLRAIGIDPDKTDTEWLEKALLDTFSTLVPIEIGTPPIPIDQLDRLDDLRERLQAARAKGTRASILYAFGFHINPELPTDDAGVIRDFLRAFLLLYPWMKERAEVDLTRRVSPYINAFPDEYARLILQADYPASRQRLIDDYLEHNPTRNRPLDMLPVLAHLDDARVMSRVEDPHLVKPRPAFHYRLPNCMLDEADWRVAHEWNTWVAVERLANDPRLLAEMSREYLDADRKSFKPFVDKWPALLEGYIEA
ncbi:MAG: hypothetical protein QOF78_4085 [Phycisphaerales bacterium]|nr:hypothetical protein [Phycisphaerales bacterium]